MFLLKSWPPQVKPKLYHISYFSVLKSHSDSLEKTSKPNKAFWNTAKYESPILLLFFLKSLNYLQWFFDLLPISLPGNIFIFGMGPQHRRRKPLVKVKMNAKVLLLYHFLSKTLWKRPLDFWISIKSHLNRILHSSWNSHLDLKSMTNCSLYNRN